MTKPTFRKKRSKLTRLLLSPLMLIVFIAGWSLYCIGQPMNQNNQQPHKTQTKQEEIELSVISQEEQIIAN